MIDNMERCTPRRGPKHSLAALSAAFAAAFVLFLGACSTLGPDRFAPSYPESTERTAPAYPDARFMVMTDIHLYDASLGTSGPAWEEYAALEQKLLKESREILAVAVDAIRTEKPDFVLVPGDLTKDGERQGHEEVAHTLAELREEGIRIYVLPGNHDINNPAARRFPPSGKAEGVPNVGPEEFARIYRESGYGEALYRDPESLSYVAQLAPKLWLLAIDSAKYDYRPNAQEPESSGAVRSRTYEWIEARLAEASRNGIAVLAAEHHPILEHADGMKERHPDFIVDDNWRLAGLLASYNVRVLFSGHFHANSVVRHSWGKDAPPALRGKHIVDVETGALSTWPCYYRSVRLSSRDGSMTVSTRRIERLPSLESEGRSLDSLGREAIERGFGSMAGSIMRRVGASRRDVAILVPQVVSAMAAHYAGDARFEGDKALTTRGLSLIGRLGAAYYRRFIRGLWDVRPPKGVEPMPDNEVTIFPDGSWAETPR
jgi:3',5'-cyclic AMP phosphodiesterase CpdA